MAHPAHIGVEEVAKVRHAVFQHGDAVEAHAPGEALIDVGIEAAGAKLMARIDHGAGAKTVGRDIGASQLLIFGNPKVGTPVMEQNRLAGLILPLHVLVYEDDQGKTWIAYENIDERLDDLDGIKAGDDSVQPLKGALAKLTNAAAGN